MSFSIRKIGMLEMPKIAMLSTAVYKGFTVEYGAFSFILIHILSSSHMHRVK